MQRGGEVGLGDDLERGLEVLRDERLDPAAVQRLRRRARLDQGRAPVRALLRLIRRSSLLSLLHQTSATLICQCAPSD